MALSGMGVAILCSECASAIVLAVAQECGWGRAFGMALALTQELKQSCGRCDRDGPATRLLLKMRGRRESCDAPTQEKRGAFVSSAPARLHFLQALPRWGRGQPSTQPRQRSCHLCCHLPVRAANGKHNPAGQPPPLGQRQPALVGKTCRNTAAASPALTHAANRISAPFVCLASIRLQIPAKQHGRPPSRARSFDHLSSMRPQYRQG